MLVDRRRDLFCKGWRPSSLKNWGRNEKSAKLSTNGISLLRQNPLSQMWSLRRQLNFTSPKQGEGSGQEIITCFPVSSRLSTKWMTSSWCHLCQLVVVNLLYSAGFNFLNAGTRISEIPALQILPCVKLSRCRQQKPMRDAEPGLGGDRKRWACWEPRPGEGRVGRWLVRVCDSAVIKS